MPVKPMPDAEGLVRQIGRAIAVASHDRTADALESPALEVAQLTAGLDPDDVDPSSLDYRFGATEAFSALINALSEQMLSLSAIDLLRKRSRAQALIAIALEPGVLQKVLSEQTGIAESNLSIYIRELAASGLIEPATPLDGGKGKAWRISPWGSHTLPQVADVLAVNVDEDQLHRAIQAALERRNRPVGVPDSEAVALIPKREVHRRIRTAALRETDEPMYASTFYDGDLKKHPHAWELTEDVIENAKRPIRWIIFNNDRTKLWVDELVQRVEGKEHFTILTLDNIAEMRSAVQVLDDDGLLYSVIRSDKGLVLPRKEAEETWNGYSERATKVLVDGKKSNAIVIKASKAFGEMKSK